MVSKYEESSNSPNSEHGAQLAARREARENRPCPWRTNMKVEADGWDNSSTMIEDDSWIEGASPMVTQLRSKDARDPLDLVILPIDLDIPFAKWHRFMNELHNTLYDSCKRFVIKSCLHGYEPEDAHEWELDRWISKIVEFQRRWNFLAPAITLEEFELACYSANEFRHSWTHRRYVSFKTIFNAMRLAYALLDHVRSEHIIGLYTTLVDPVADFDEDLFPETPLRFAYEVLGRVETALARPLFELWRKMNPEEVSEDAVPEMYEWSHWENKFTYTYLPQDKFPDPNRRLLGDLLRSAREIRNDHAHKNSNHLFTTVSRLQYNLQ